MMRHRHGRRLDAWMTAVLHEDLPELHSFLTGLRRDQDAVTAGLTLPYSSGPEGHVNRIKMIKRQMYGAPTPTRSANASCRPIEPDHGKRVRARIRASLTHQRPTRSDTRVLRPFKGFREGRR